MAHCLIIGGSKGLGRVLARVFSERNDKVSVIGRTAPKTPGSQPGIIDYWCVDLEDRAGLLSALNDIISRNGPLNYLVFSQRYRGREDSWTGELSISLTSTKLVIEELNSRFDPSGDKCIVLVSSVFGSYVGEGQDISYHVAKAGLNQMARYYAVNLAKKGIRVNAVTSFTFLKDESKHHYLNNHLLMDLYAEITPLGRMPTAEDIANVIAYLCSAGAGFVNGQNIYVDGGLSLVWPESLAKRLRSM